MKKKVIKAKAAKPAEGTGAERYIACGRRGGIARWGKKHGPTVTVRVEQTQAVRLLEAVQVVERAKFVAEAIKAGFKDGIDHQTHVSDAASGRWGYRHNKTVTVRTFKREADRVRKLNERSRSAFLTESLRRALDRIEQQKAV